MTVSAIRYFYVLIASFALVLSGCDRTSSSIPEPIDLSDASDASAATDPSDSNGSDQSDASDASDGSDLSDTSDPSTTESDVSDASDPTDESDMTDPSDPTDVSDTTDASDRGNTRSRQRTDASKRSVAIVCKYSRRYSSIQPFARHWRGAWWLPCHEIGRVSHPTDV